MPKSINLVILLGNLTRDPELRYTQSGTAVANSSLATNKQWKDDSGEMKESAEFHNLVFWGNLAELVAQYCNKGSKVHVTGELQTRSWETDRGIKKYKTEINVKDIVFLDSKRDYDPSEPAKETKAEDVSDDFDSFMSEDDIDDGEEPPVKGEDIVTDAEDIADDIPF